MCLHNIYNKPVREKAYSEIFRVLKSEGLAIIFDYKLVDEYAQIFHSLGAKVEKMDNAWFSAAIKTNKF
jgi:ubiquinone/menaquinone biosynthesis C-methylase UbiE